MFWNSLETWYNHKTTRSNGVLISIRLERGTKDKKRMKGFWEYIRGRVPVLNHPNERAEAVPRRYPPSYYKIVCLLVYIMAGLKLWKQGERDRAEHFLVKQIPICAKSTPKESCIASSWVVEIQKS